MSALGALTEPVRWQALFMVINHVLNSRNNNEEIDIDIPILDEMIKHRLLK